MLRHSRRAERPDPPAPPAFAPGAGLAAGHRIRPAPGPGRFAGRRAG